MNTQTVFLIVGYFFAGWLLGGFAFVAPQIVKSIRARRAAQTRTNDLFRR